MPSEKMRSIEKLCKQVLIYNDKVRRMRIYYSLHPKVLSLIDEAYELSIKIQTLRDQKRRSKFLMPTPLLNSVFKYWQIPAHQPELCLPFLSLLDEIFEDNFAAADSAMYIHQELAYILHRNQQPDIPRARSVTEFPSLYTEPLSLCSEPRVDHRVPYDLLCLCFEVRNLILITPELDALWRRKSNEYAPAAGVTYPDWFEPLQEMADHCEYLEECKWHGTQPNPISVLMRYDASILVTAVEELWASQAYRTHTWLPQLYAIVQLYKTPLEKTFSGVRMWIKHAYSAALREKLAGSPLCPWQKKLLKRVKADKKKRMPPAPQPHPMEYYLSIA